MRPPDWAESTTSCVAALLLHEGVQFVDDGEKISPESVLHEFDGSARLPESAPSRKRRRDDDKVG